MKRRIALLTAVVLLCLGGGRDLEMDRVRLEKAVRERIAAQDAASETKA